MSRPDVFLDSSALFAGIVSAEGAARALLMMAEAGLLTITVSEQVIAETERALARKLPLALDDLRATLRHTRLRIVRDPAPEAVEAHTGVIAHLADVPIVVAAMQAGVDYLATLNRRHFIDDPDVAARSGLRIGTPGDALGWALNQLGAPTPDEAEK
jgi:predicted nucleic acid-binding protein